MKEKFPLVCSDDYGVDEPTAQSLLQRHKDLFGEINAYDGDIKALNAQAQNLIKAGVSVLDVSLQYLLFLFAIHLDDLFKNFLMLASSKRTGKNAF